MMKERKKKINVFFALVATAIIILSIFAVITRYQVNDLTTTAKEKESLPLLVSISADKTSGIIPLEISFTPIISNAMGKTKCLWDFGDGETSDEINPTHAYQENGSYVCNLTVIDSNGEQISDTVEISANNNRKPTVTIRVEPVTSNRPYLIGLPSLSMTYGGRFIDFLINLPVVPPRLSNLEGWVHCEAQVNDPDGDEIVSFKWELRPSSYQKPLFMGGGTEQPVYHFEGESVTFPGKYTYRTGKYDVTLTVEDAAGNNASVTTQFKIEKSQTKSRLDGVKGQYNIINDKWLKKWSKGAIGALVMATIVDKWPENPIMPRLTAGLLLFLQLGWQIVLENESVLKAYGGFLEKHPVRQKIVKNFLEGTIDGLELLKQKASKPNMQDAIQTVIDILQGVLKELGLTNIMPELSDENPSDKSKSISITCPRVAITVTDAEGDPFNVSIHGDYVNDIYLTNQSNGTFTATLTTPLPDLTEICWHVNVSDLQGRWVNKTYQFRTW